jgi:Putative DNA-binding domain
MPDSAQIFFDSLGAAADVPALVGRAEDLYFEAKRCADLFSETDQEHLAEALAGFANADGGVLIYGLVAEGGDRDKPDIVTRVERVKKLDLTNSRILALVGQLVEPPVPNVQVVPREFDRLPGEGFVLVYVPPSDLVPHRSRKDREYYRRHGQGFYRMEHFEIAEVFGRRRRPSLSLTWSLPVSTRRFNFYNEQRVNIVIGMHNAGRGSARYPALRIYGATPNHMFGLDGSGGVGLPKRAASQGHLFAGGSDHVIYPDAHLEVTALLHPVDFSGAVPWQGFALEYELFAEEMEVVKGSLRISGKDLQAAFDCAEPIVHSMSSQGQLFRTESS